MNETYNKFLTVYRLALNKKEKKTSSCIQFDYEDNTVLRQLFALADSHCVFPMVFDAIYALKNENEKESSFYRKEKKKAERLTCGQARMTAEFLRLYRYLLKKNLHPIVMKGIICRNLYPEPEQRSSLDEDLFVPEDQFSLYHKVLTDFGLRVASDDADIEKDFEVSYYNDKIFIELHKKPFPPESKVYGDLNRFFENIEEKKITEIVYGVEVNTVDYADHLFYQICHAYKHFLNCGIGIRLVSDIVLYSLTYAENIDWKKVTEQCREIHAFDLCSALYRIGEKYLYPERFPEFLKEVWHTSEADELSLLVDIIAGGLYGTSNENRLHSANLTLYAAEKETADIRSSAILHALFPSYSSMQNRYSYLKKYPILLPYAWLHRIANYGKGSVFQRRSGNQISETVRIGNERVALMKRYQVLNDKEEKTGLFKMLYKKSHSSFLAPVLSPLFLLISTLEYHILNLVWYIKGDRMPSEEDRLLVRNNLTFIVKSFERQHLVKGLCKNLTRMYPGAAIIIADDSHEPLYIDLPEVTVVHLPFNSGLSAGLAAALERVRTPYVMRLDDDELLTVRSKVHRELRFLEEHSELDLIGFGHTTAIRLHSPEFNFRDYYKSPMKDAVKPLKIPHLTKIDENHIVLGKAANIYLAKTEKMREVGFDPNIKIIDHHDFFWRAAGIMACAVALDTVVFHRHNPYERKYREYRSDYRSDLEYIRNKHSRMIKEARKNNENIV